MGERAPSPRSASPQPSPAERGLNRSVVTTPRPSDRRLEADPLVGAGLGHDEVAVGAVGAHRAQAPVLGGRRRLPRVALAEGVGREPGLRAQVAAEERVRFAAPRRRRASRSAASGRGDRRSSIRTALRPRPAAARARARPSPAGPCTRSGLSGFASRDGGLRGAPGELVARRPPSSTASAAFER